MLGEKVLKNKRKENVLSKGGQAVLLHYICHAAILLTREIYYTSVKCCEFWSSVCFHRTLVWPCML